MARKTRAGRVTVSTTRLIIGANSAGIMPNDLSTEPSMINRTSTPTLLKTWLESDPNIALPRRNLCQSWVARIILPAARPDKRPTLHPIFPGPAAVGAGDHLPVDPGDGLMAERRRCRFPGAAAG